MENYDNQNSRFFFCLFQTELSNLYLHISPWDYATTRCDFFFFLRGGCLFFSSVFFSPCFFVSLNYISQYVVHNLILLIYLAMCAPGAFEQAANIWSVCLFFSLLALLYKYWCAVLFPPAALELFSKSCLTCRDHWQVLFEPLGHCWVHGNK